MSNANTLTSESLQLIVNEVFNEYRNSSEDALESLLNVQRHFSKAYKTRHFLELLQNARDAIVALGIANGKIKVWLDGDDFYFANNGKDFDRKGVRSICFTAISEKESIKFVGHKGIGFNSVLEITDKPQIITRVGSFYFDTLVTAGILGKGNAERLPLFQFPIYSSYTIADLNPELLAEGFTTVFKLPLKSSFRDRLALTANHSIQAQDLLFLRAIKELSMQEERIVWDDKLLPIRVEQSGKDDVFYQPYSTEFSFSDEEFNYFDQDEKDLFKDSRRVDCRFLLKVDNEGKFQRDHWSKLHLYYGMETTTGFGFAIHSFFSVSLDRKRLSDNSLVNNSLFKYIAQYYCGAFLDSIKLDFPSQVLEILCYQRQDNNGLLKFYDALRYYWTSAEFIYHEPSQRFLKPSEVLLVSEREYAVFRNGFLGSRALLYVADFRVKEWLQKECAVSEIYDNFIELNIEAKCLEYQNDPSFFRDFYELVEIRKLSLSSKKVLLTQNFQLVSGRSAQVYHLRKVSFTTPKELDSEISFIHPETDLSRLRDDTLRWLGVHDYSQQNLIDVSAKVLKQTGLEEEKDRQTILNIISFLYQFESIEDGNFAKIRDDIFLPVIHMATGSRKWVHPLYDCVYFSDFSFSALYDQECWILDEEKLGLAVGEKSRVFMGNLGVWTLPGIAIVATDFAPGEVFEIKGDRKLHMPKKVSKTFYEAIISNWSLYQRFITTSLFSDKLTLYNRSSVTSFQQVQASTVYAQLCSTPWMLASKNGIKSFYRPVQVIALETDEFRKNVNQVWMDYFPIIEFDALLNDEFSTAFGLKHFKGNFIEKYIEILSFFKESYPELKEITDAGNFEKCFHRYLGYLSGFLQRAPYSSNTDKLKTSSFLSKDVRSGAYHWTLGQDCLLIDKKPVLDKRRSQGLLMELQHPNAFTKRDRNEWGRYAKDIGKPLSGLVRAQMRHEGKAEKFCSVFRHPEIILAFVEYDLERHFTVEEILKFKTAEVFIHQPLEVDYQVGEKELLINQDHYVSGDKEQTVLHLNRRCLNMPRLSSSALLDYFEQYTSKELKRFEFVFEAILTLSKRGQQRFDYAAEKHIDVSRIEDIGKMLYENYYVESEEVESVEQIPVWENTNHQGSTQSSTIITKEIEVVDIDSGLSDEEMLMNLDNLLDCPASAFSAEAGDEDFSFPQDSDMALDEDLLIIQDRASGMPRREISDKTKDDIGFYAEYYVFQKLKSKNEKFLKLLELSAQDASSLEWFNIHRIGNRMLSDKSVGKGCDFFSSSLNLALEVKGMHRKSPYFTITGPEFACMKRYGVHYFLVVVTGLYQGEHIKTIVIRDPYEAILSGKLKFAEAKVYAAE